MDPLEYLRALRRRWAVVLGLFGVALVVAFATTTFAPVSVGPTTHQYQATTQLISTGNGNGNSGFGDLGTIASLATIPDVAKRVAADIHYSGDPSKLASQVQASQDPKTSLLKITATSPDPQQAKILADKFSVELLAWLKQKAANTNAAEAAVLRGELNGLQQDIAKLDTQLSANPKGTQHDLLQAQRNAKVQTYGQLSNQYQQFSVQSTGPDLIIIQSAVPEIVEPTGFQAPRSLKFRYILAGILGLLLGIVLALVLERFDTRIRNKKAAEKHFGLPVLAEIPFVPRLKRWSLGRISRRIRSGGSPVVMPKFPRVGDSFRLLGAGISRGPLASTNGQEGRLRNGRSRANTPAGAILVTSPGPGEGKTTVVANLALTFAQAGRRVIVLSCDFRRPQIHELFGLSNSDGLVDALESGSDGAVLNGHIKPTPVRDVRVVPSGHQPANAPGLLSSERMRAAVDEARREADIVLVDTAPLLTSAEVTHLFPLVDAVLVVARARKTTEELAERAGELLKRLDAPVVGVALNGATEVPLPSGHTKYWQVLN